MNEQWIAEAKALGAEHARNAASWCFDGNSDKQERAKVLAMLRDGDPMAYDYLPQEPSLSGEFADDLNPARLYAEIVGASPETDGEAVHAIPLCDELAEAYMEGVSETFSLACEAELITFCGDVGGSLAPLDPDARYSVAGYGGVAFYLERRIDPQTVIAVMVGDDREHVIDVDDLTVIGEDDYCHECGQIGCKGDQL